MKPLYLLLPAMLLLVAGCKKDPIKALPKATQDGKNTMGCLVDGKAWTPKGSSGGIVGSGSVDPITAYWTRRRTGGGDLALSFNRKKDGESQSYIHLFLPALTQTGNVQMNQISNPSNGWANPAYGQYILYNNLPYPKFLTGPDAVGNVMLTRLDTVAGIASGTFSFTGRHAASGQTVDVSEGRFDVRFTKQ